MENASKALMIAAEVLVGVIIISIGVYLFSMFAEHSKEAYQKMSDAQIAQFNSQFLKYYGSSSDSTGNIVPITCSAHDIITTANLAAQNNKQYELEKETKFEDGTFYIQVDIGRKTGSSIEIANLEKWNDTQKINFLAEASKIIKNSTKTEAQIKEYICKEAHISPITKRVNYMIFIPK